MNPLFLVVAPMVLMGNRNRSRKKKKGAQEQQRTRGVGKRPRPRPAYARRGNGKIKQQWTSFPWQADRVTQVAQELLEKGEKDPDNLTLAVAKTIYPVHPISGMEFAWPPADGPDRDVGARMIWERIRLRVNTLVAADEERLADEATVMAAEEAAEEAAKAQEAPPPEEGDESEPDEAADAEAEDDDDSDEEENVSSPRIGRVAPPPMAEPLPAPVARRRPLTLSRKRTMRRRPRVDPYALHPEDNRIADGLYHTVQGAETIQAIAQNALAAHIDPTGGQIAQYVSLIVCSPANSLPTVWDDEHDVPGAAPYPWGAERPTLWLPKLNEQKLHDGVVTTLGITWPDGSNGITPPPEMIPRD